MPGDSPDRESGTPAGAPPPGSAPPGSDWADDDTGAVEGGVHGIGDNADSRAQDSQRTRRVSPVTPDTPRGRAVAQRAKRNVKRSHGRGGRRRNDGSELVVISWRDIPAQVNGGSGDMRIQRILPRRFQRAIDRAAMVAGKTEASQYVAEWRRSTAPGDPSDPQRATLAAAAELEEAFPMERLDRFVESGGWDPDPV